MRGAIFDGFPRNLVQATALDAITRTTGRHRPGSADPELEDDDAMRRITGGGVCRSCGAVYHIDFQPAEARGRVRCGRRRRLYQH